MQLRPSLLYTRPPAVYAPSAQRPHAPSGPTGGHFGQQEKADLAVFESSTSGLKYALAKHTRHGHPPKIIASSMVNTFLKEQPTLEAKKASYQKALREVAQEIQPFLPNSGRVHGWGIATAVFRDHPELQVLLEMKQQTLKVPTTVISGDEEAALFYRGTYTGFVEEHPLAKGRRIVALDPGGGSTEMVVGNSSQPHRLTSLPIGDSLPEGRADAFDLAYIQTIRESTQKSVHAVAHRAEQERVAHALSFFKPDYAVWGFLPDQLNVLHRASLKALNKDIFKVPITRDDLAYWTESPERVQTLKTLAQELDQQHGGKRPYAFANSRRLGVNLGVMQGVMDALGVEKLYLKDYGGVKAGALEKLAHQQGTSA